MASSILRAPPVFSEVVLDAPPQPSRINWVDMLLVGLFLIGIYTNYTIAVSAKVPLPSAPAGLAGLILLVRRQEAIRPATFAGLPLVLLAFVVSMLFAPDLSFLPRRLNGLIQLTYSLLIGYALFLTLIRATPRQVAGLFLSSALILLGGCLLETYGGLRTFSDQVRAVLYNRGLYDNDLRDMLIYHRVRPKFFASEPASVTFCYTLFSFLWLVTSRWRFKFPLYLALMAGGLFVLPGPTVLLMLLLVLPYLLFLDSRRNGRIEALRFLRVSVVAACCAAAFAVLAPSLFQERLRQIQSGNDASFFYRIQGPALAGVAVLRSHPVAGAGLSGEPYIEDEVLNVYANSPGYSTAWKLVTPATELLINYFWLHWIYLGVFFGVLIAVLMSWWLLALGVPSVAFVWMCWAVMGQASGAYVGPTCWAVVFATAAAAVLHQRSEPLAKNLSVRAPPVTFLANRLARLSFASRD